MYTYIHIPFCKSKCSYCDFFSVVVQKNDIDKDNSQIKYISDDYIQAILQEAKYRVSLHNINSWSSLYIGGGTPILLTIDQVETLINGLKRLCPLKKKSEITFEVNPFEIAQSDGLDYLNNLSSIGINRISCGIQALDDEVLHSVNRRSTKMECITALQNLLKWKEQHKSENNRTAQFSIDLIAGLPNHSVTSFLNGLEQVLRYNPDHISLYSLMIEEGTPLYFHLENGSIQYNNDYCDELWMRGRDYLLENKFYQYEVSNFAYADNSGMFESDHNKAYWKMKDYIGLGCAACGTVAGTRYTGTNDINAYTQFWNTGVIKKELSDICYVETLSIQDQIIEYLMMGFRTLQGVSSIEFYNRFNMSLEEVIGTVFFKWYKKKYACKNNEYYSLNKNGILFLNLFLNEIMLQL